MPRQAIDADGFTLKSNAEQTTILLSHYDMTRIQSPCNMDPAFGAEKP